jgi:hypothetical protein
MEMRLKYSDQVANAKCVLQDQKEIQVQVVQLDHQDRKDRQDPQVLDLAMDSLDHPAYRATPDLQDNRELRERLVQKVRMVRVVSVLKGQKAHLEKQDLLEIKVPQVRVHRDKDQLDHQDCQVQVDRQAKQVQMVLLVLQERRVMLATTHNIVHAHPVVLY